LIINNFRWPLMLYDVSCIHTALLLFYYYLELPEYSRSS